MIISIVFIILALICIWLFFDYKYGRKRHEEKHRTLTFPERKSDFLFYADGNDLFLDLFKEIRSAKDHIHVLFYIVKNDAFSQEFLKLLEEKAREGVEVRLLLDWVGSFGIKRKFKNSLKRNGVQFSFCQVPHLPFLFYSVQERNHRKITIIDGKVGYFGGFNIGKEYIGFDPRLSPWRDYHLKIKGEGVQDLQRQFLKDWMDSTKSSVSGDRYYPTLPSGSIRHKFSASEGVHLEEVYVQFVKGAKKSLFIGSPYFIPSHTLFEALLEALNRGIEITIVVPKKSDHLLVQEASYRYFRILHQKGATIYQYDNGFFHAKILIRDDTICDIGTTNFDKRSLFINHELNCYIYDPDFILHAKGQLLQDITESQPLNLQEINKPDFSRSLKELVAKSVSDFL